MKKLSRSSAALVFVLFPILFLLVTFLLPLHLHIEIQLPQEDSIHVFEDTGNNYNDKELQVVPVKNSDRSQYKVKLGISTKRVRVDLGHRLGDILVYSLTLRYGNLFTLKSWNSDNQFFGWKPFSHIGDWKNEPGHIRIESVGNDPGIECYLSRRVRVLYLLYNCGACFLIMLLVWLVSQLTRISSKYANQLQKKGYKRILFTTILLMMIVVFFELLSLLIIKIKYDAGMSQSSQTNLSEILFHKQAVHPYLGYAYMNQSYGFLMDKENVEVKRSPNKIIIGVVGGSVAAIFASLELKTFTQELQKFPRFQNKEIIIINLAAGGYKQPQQIMALNFFMALGGEVDMLLNIDGFNEVALYPAENLGSGLPLIFPRSWHLIGSSHSDVTLLKLKSQLLQMKEQQRSLQTFFEESFFTYSSSIRLTCHLYNSILANKVIATYGEIVEYEQGSNVPFANYEYSDDQQLYIELTEIWQRCSVQLSKICIANDVQYFHFLQPNQYVTGSKPMSEEERNIAYCPNHDYKPGVEYGYPLLQIKGKTLQSQGVVFQDLTMIFQDCHEPIYIDSCCHFNQLGNEIMARAIAKTIIQAQK